MSSEAGGTDLTAAISMGYMVQIRPGFVWIFALILPVFPGWYLHEGTHWFIGLVAGTDPQPRCVLWIVPIAIEHGRIMDVDPGVIRLLGLGIFHWLPIQLLAIAYLLAELTPSNLFIAMVPFYILIVTTESDVLAVRDPEKYREMELAGELSDQSPIRRWITDRFLK
jgi:hypothetical protein